ncbi:hypothetical protein ABLE94_09035 [Gordonia sp. VNK1]|jgi:hypothetical protein|uniref:hypothetical protein n=1 Tax=Gordonia oleivorans TaxID=3156618 RepID=UPI0032B35DE8
MTRKKILVLIASVATVLTALFAAQSTGVLAEWSDAAWGGSDFQRGDWVREGYARATAARYTGSDGTTTAASAERTHSNPGDSGTVSGSLDISGGLNYETQAAASVQARFTQTQGGLATSYLQSFTTNYSSSNRVTLNGAISTSVTCAIDGATPTVTAPTGSIIVRNALGTSPQTVTIPGPNQTSSGSSGSVSVALTHVQTIADDTAVSTLSLTASQGSLWSYSGVLVHAECGVGGYVPSSLGAMTVNGPDEQAADEEQGEEQDDEEHADGEAEDSENGAAAESEDAESEDAGTSDSGPTSPTAVRLNQGFEVISTDGTHLATATLHEIDNNATTSGGPSTVAVRMTVTTSDEDSADRLSTISSDSFRQVLGTTTAAVTAADTVPSPALSTRLQAGRTYTGWVAFTVRSGTSTVMWLPDGTAGWTFTLPAVSVTEPAEPTTTTPTAPTSAAPAPTTPSTATPSTTAPAVTEPVQPTPDVSTDTGASTSSPGASGSEQVATAPSAATPSTPTRTTSGSAAAGAAPGTGR